MSPFGEVKRKRGQSLVSGPPKSKVCDDGHIAFAQLSLSLSVREDAAMRSSLGLLTQWGHIDEPSHSRGR
jgi:hypothetical protein